jgi:hypothetical protein
MTTTILSASLTVQGVPATTRPTSTQNPSPAVKPDVQASARDFGDAIRNSVQQEVNAALSQSAAARRAVAAAQAQGGGPVLAPAAPTQPGGRTFEIRGRDGLQTITIPPHAFDNTIPPQAVDMTVAFFLTVAVIIIGLPLARAFARRMDRRGGVAQIPNEVSSQLAHLNQAVDAIALEVERISEGQRFTTRLLSEQRDAARQTLPAGTDR